MKIRNFLPFLALLSISTLASGADGLAETDWKIPGDSAITSDPSTGLEWLDLSVTQNLSLDQVLTELSPGGLFEEFSLATPEQVGTLFSSAGLTTISIEPNTTSSSTVVTEIAAAKMLQTLWGITSTNAGLELKRSVAFVNDQPVVGGATFYVSTLDVFPTKYGAATRGSSANSTSMSFASALVRNGAPVELPTNFLDFERDGAGQLISAVFADFPSEEYTAAGVTIVASNQLFTPERIVVLNTSTTPDETTISGNVLYAEFVGEEATTADITFINGSREVAFDFSVLSFIANQIRVQVFGEADALLVDSVFVGDGQFDFVFPGAGPVGFPAGQGAVDTGLTITRIHIDAGGNPFFIDNLRYEAAIPVSSSIASDAMLGSGVFIGENVTIESGVSIGDNATISNNVTIGENSILAAAGIIGESTQIGKNSMIGSEYNIGSNVVIGKNTIIGDQAILEDQSLVAKNSVIGNEVIIGNNVSIAKDTLIEDSVSIGDESTIHKNSTIEANAILGINVTVGSNATVTNGTFVPANSNIPSSTTFP